MHAVAAAAGRGKVFAMRRTLILLPFALALAGCRTVTAPRTPATVDIPASLRYVRQELPPEQNAYILWTNAFAHFKPPANEAVREVRDFTANFVHSNLPTGKLRQELDAYLAEQEPAIILLKQGLAKGQYQPPPPEPNTLPAGIRELPSLCELMRLRARILVEQGAPDQAIEECLAAHASGHLYAGSGGPLQIIVGAGLQEEALRSLRWCCRTAKPTTNVLRMALSAISEQGSADISLARAYQVEYRDFVLLATRQLAQFASSPTNGVPVSTVELFDASDAVSLITPYYAIAVTNALQPWCQRLVMPDSESLLPKAALPSAWDEDSFAPEFFLLSDKDAAVWNEISKLNRDHPNILARLFFRDTSRSLLATLKCSVRARTRVNLTRACLGVRIFRAETGAWPETLEAVVARGILPAVPQDLFSGHPVHYSRDKGILLWSTGPNSVDDGADEKKDLIIRLQP